MATFTTTYGNGPIVAVLTHMVGGTRGVHYFADADTARGQFDAMVALLGESQRTGDVLDPASPRTPDRRTGSSVTDGVTRAVTIDLALAGYDGDNECTNCHAHIAEPHSPSCAFERIADTGADGVSIGWV